MSPGPAGNSRVHAMTGKTGGFGDETSRTPGWHDQNPSNERAQPTRILIVDDDPMIRQMVANYLEGHNMRVLSASQRDEVVRHFSTTEPHLVILDLRLGDADGLDLLREIRSG